MRPFDIVSQNKQARKTEPAVRHVSVIQTSHKTDSVGSLFSEDPAVFMTAMRAFNNMVAVERVVKQSNELLRTIVAIHRRLRRLIESQMVKAHD